MNNALLKKKLLQQQQRNQIIPNSKYKQTRTSTTIITNPSNNIISNDVSTVIIGQQSTDKPINTEQFNRYVEQLNRIRPKELDDAYKTRKNTPYKNILSEEYFKENYSNPDELIIYKNDHKNNVNLKKDIIKIKNNRILLDNDLKQKYNKTDEEKYKQDFEYNNIKKYNINYVQPELKNNAKEFYIKQQQQYENTKQNIDDVIENMLNDD